jgi:hypothetical protein
MSGATDPGSSALPSSEGSRLESGGASTEDQSGQAEDPASSALPSSEGSRLENGGVSTENPSGQAADPTLYPQSEQLEASSTIPTGPAVDPNEAHPMKLATVPSPPVSPDVEEIHVDLVAPASSRPAPIITAQEPPAQATPAQETPAQETPAQDTPVHNTSASLISSRPTTVATTQEMTAQEMTAQEMTAQEMTAQEMTAQEMTAQETTAQETTTPATPVQETPVQETPVQETPVQETPVQETPVQQTPVQEMPIQETLAKETPAQESLVRDTSVSPNSSSLTATPTVQDPLNRERTHHDLYVSPTSSRPTTITAAEARSFQNDSRVRLLNSTRHSRSFSVQGQPPSRHSVNDDRGSTRLPSHVSRTQNLRKTAPRRLKWWKPWKIRSFWLSILLIITMFLVFTILSLVAISNEEQGFTPLWNPPGFLARLPAFENNIWSQGVLYTSLPAFFMTLYSLMFSLTVNCFMDLQPCMDLAKLDGATARTTIMLDYRQYFMFKNVYVAFRNKHLLLAFYMLLSTALTIAIIPLTAFLFVSSPVNTNTTAPISFTTAFDDSSLLAIPDFGLAVDYAAAFRIYDASPPPWTDGEYAFPKVVPLNIDIEEITDSNLTVRTTGYSAYIDCRIIPEEEYNLTVVDPTGVNDPGIVIQISANDRGCAILNDLTFVPKSVEGEQVNATVIKVWRTQDCISAAGHSRLSIASGLYAQSLTNFSLISCIPSYWTTPGTLTMTMTSLTGPPLVQSFSANGSQAVESGSIAMAYYFELNIQYIGCVNPTTGLVSSVYGRQIYTLASKAYPESPLLPEAISNAAQTLFTSIYAVLVSTSIFQPISPATNSTGIKTTNVTRLVVMVPIAYTITLILFGVVLAIVTMFGYGNKPNVLDKEPIGLLSSAIILHRSTVTQLMDEVHAAPEYDDSRMIEGLERKGISPDTVLIVESYSPLRVIVKDLETELH